MSENYITKEEMAEAAKAAKAKQISIANYLVAEGVMSKDLIGQAFAESYNLPYADLNSNQPAREQVLEIPEAVAKKYRVVLFQKSKKGNVITTDSPKAKGLTTELKKLFPKMRLALQYSLPADIEVSLGHYQQSLATRFSKIIESEKKVAPEIIDQILSDALSFRASDIHFEPLKTEVVIRFRVDGVLQEAGRIPKQYYENILNRIKVQNRLRIDEHFAAQDGSMHYGGEDDSEGGDVDIRTSIVPTVEGEKVVMRLLASYLQGYALSDIGLNERHQSVLERAAKKPFGMILVTGPTGSGKTTTLYTLLKMLNKPGVNITTIEDPVEYKVDGINQIQVNAATNLTFAKGLRSIVRQDPDIILVGEIRDIETAEIAINAALTGHLLLSTFHANDAATAIPRLLDMKAEAFLLASTLEVVAAQRLVRNLCESCRYSYTVSPSEIDLPSKFKTKYFGKRKVTLYKGKGCEVCGHTGYQGQSGIFEVIEVTSDMQDLILKNPSSQEIWKLARKQGSLSLFEDGLEKVKAGVTSLEEVLRVASVPDF